MLNAEKWKKEILDITEGGYYFAVSKDRQNIARSCDGLKCENCIFDEEDDHDCGCNFSRMKWMLSEYKEPVKLSKLEYDILEYISDNTEYLYIARESTSNIFVYRLEPTKGTHGWKGRGYTPLTAFKKLFLFIKWEDKEATSIKDVLENCVIENIKEEQ